MKFQYSVLMSVYYKEKPEYLKQAIESILCQTVQPDDFVLVCDGPLNLELDAVIAAKQQEKIEQQQIALESKSKEIVQLSATITEMQPKVSYVDTILSCKETVTTTQIAQDYGQSAKAFNILLRNFGVQHKVGGQWILYAKYLPCGYVQSETVSITHRDGSVGSVMHTKWTQKGRLFLYNELKKHDILPLIEK